MSRSRKPSFSVSIAQGALESIYDECDRYDVDETGGRLVGFYHKKGTHHDIEVMGTIPPGPNAQRSPTSFFQDGEYQEKVFRSIEENHPNIEHLGNWHTHHVNGYPTLSSGDRTTYFKTVNHNKHNTDFFYALLVLRRNPGGNPRYDIKHYVFRRGDNAIYEIPPAQVRLLNAPTVLPGNVDRAASLPHTVQVSRQPDFPNLERANDQKFFAEFYPDLKALFSKSFGTLYWKGPLGLIDGSHIDVVAMENAGDGVPFYRIAIAHNAKSTLIDISAGYKERQFRSARHAVFYLEKDLNRALYDGKKG